MELQTRFHSYRFGDYQIEACVPEPLALQQWYSKQLQTDQPTAAPYWAQVWPSAYALCEFIATKPDLLQNKKVLELAAGVGLPSLLAAQFAMQVVCSDHVPAAIECMQRSVEKNQLANISTLTIDWNDLPDNLSCDILLLSDINYEPQVFETVFNMMLSFLEKGTTILLSTPQRLMAKPFIESILPYSTHWEEKFVTNTHPIVACSVYVLEK